MPCEWFGGNADFAEFIKETKNKSSSSSEFYKEMGDEIAANYAWYFTDFDREGVNETLQRLDDLVDQ